MREQAWYRGTGVAIQRLFWAPSLAKVSLVKVSLGKVRLDGLHRMAGEREE
jgi:hypothetical protein